VIAGITHLTMEAVLPRGIELGERLGFRLEFSDELSLPGSFEGLAHGEQRLPLALLAGSRGIRFEVVQHRERSGRPGAYAGLFRCAPPEQTARPIDRPRTREVLRSAAVLAEPTCVVLEASGGEAWFDGADGADGSDEVAEAGGGGLAGLLCYVGDVRAEAQFWSRFARVRWRRLDADAACGSVPSPLPQTQCELVLVRRDSEHEHLPDGPGPHSMNDNGFPSIGVFGTAIERDCAKAVSAGAVLRAQPIVTTVGGRVLRMALIETPGGAPVELLGAHRAAAA
jgi:hypothetical protein